MPVWTIILIVVLVIGGGIAAWYFLKPKAGTSNNLPAPGTKGSGTGGGTPGTTAPPPGVPYGNGAIITVGARTFKANASGFTINGYSNSSALNKATIPFPKFTDGTYVADPDLINQYVAVVAGSLGDGCGYDFTELSGRYNTLIEAGVANVPNTF